MRCPVCKAENSTGPQCRRCRADLRVLYDLETARDASLLDAESAYSRGAIDEALTLAQRADHLRRDGESCRLLALLCLVLGRYVEARVWAARCQS